MEESFYSLKFIKLILNQSLLYRGEKNTTIHYKDL